jgi:predicted aspartyl protease
MTIAEEIRGGPKMGHIYVDIVVKGSKSSANLSRVLVDTGATYTVLPQSVLDEVGAWGPMREVEIGLGDGRKITGKAYGVVIGIEDAEAPAISIAFEDAQTVIGVETLESLGLKLDPSTGRIEAVRPKGMAYFFSARLS